MKTNMYSIEIANIVKQFLTEDSWNFSFDEEHGIFKFGLRIKGKIHSLKYFISIRTNEIIVYGICPIGVDEEDNKMMMEMAEFLHRVNWGLRNGCFEFDFRDGEIRFRSYIDYFPVPVAGNTPHVFFSIERTVNWQIQSEERPRVRSQDLYAKLSFWGRSSTYLAVKTTANANIYLIPITDFLPAVTGVPVIV